MLNKYQALSICSGIGGLEIAANLSSLNIEPIAFVEKDKNCQKVLRKRFPEVPIFRDLCNLTHEQLVKSGITTIDAIYGGLPCQPYSIQGKRKGEKDNRELFKQYFRLLKGIRPKWSLIENVTGLLSINHGNEFKNILNSFFQTGYNVEWQTLSCSAIGGTHKRERLFIAVFKEINNSSFKILDRFAQFTAQGKLLKIQNEFCQINLDHSLEEYSEIFPRQGFMSNGNIYNIAPVQKSSKQDNLSLLLPTPKHSDKNTSGVKSHNPGQTLHLSTAVRKLLPTPKNSDTKRLADSKDYDWRSLPGALNEKLNNKSKLRLNPDFVELMMGFPLGWTNLEVENPQKIFLLQLNQLGEYLPMALDDSVKSDRKQRLGQLGNAVVPQVGKLAFDILAKKLRSKPPAPAQTSKIPVLVKNRQDKLELIADIAFPKRVESDKPKTSTIVENSTDSPELDNLESLVKTEAQGISTYLEVGQALIKLRELKMYRTRGYRSFNLYCEEILSLSTARIYQYINAAITFSSIKEEVEKLKITLTEYHCRELAKIKDIALRKQVILKISNDRITAKLIQQTSRKLKLMKLETKPLPTLPKLNEVVRLTTNFNEKYKQYMGYWGIVTNVYEYTIDVKVLGEVIENLPSQDFMMLGNIPEAKFIAERLEKIMLSDKINSTVKTLLVDISTSSYPVLNEWQKRYLIFTENLLFGIEDEQKNTVKKGA